jgi:hypothetical protein
VKVTREHVLMALGRAQHEAVRLGLPDSQNWQVIAGEKGLTPWKAVHITDSGGQRPIIGSGFGGDIGWSKKEAYARLDAIARTLHVFWDERQIELARGRLLEYDPISGARK